MNNAINPYRQRGMILKPEEFCGRVRELREAFALMKTMQSVSVVGERRIGKSSFLNRLAVPQNGELDAGFTIHYLDLQRVFSVREFYARACRKLDREDGESRLDLEEAIQNRKVIFCLDEFENAYKHDFGSEFFDALRSLAQTGNLALVVATQTPLNELHAQFLLDTDVTSKFHNIFTRLNLDGFTPEEAREMVITERHGHRFSDEETRAILKLGGTHPYKLRLACSIFFDAKQDGLIPLGKITNTVRKKLQLRFDTEVASTFYSRSENIENTKPSSLLLPANQQTIATAPATHEAITAAPTAPEAKMKWPLAALIWIAFVLGMLWGAISILYLTRKYPPSTEVRSASISIAMIHPAYVSLGDESEMELIITNRSNEDFTGSAVISFPNGSNNTASVSPLPSETTVFKVDHLSSNASVTYRLRFSLRNKIEWFSKKAIHTRLQLKSNECAFQPIDGPQIEVAPFPLLRTINSWLGSSAVIAAVASLLWEVTRRRFFGVDAK